MHTKNRSRQSASRGFTLIEILIVIGMLAILATVVLVAINPLRQFAQARNSQRQANVSALLNAVGNRIADNRGIFENGENCPPLPREHMLEISSDGYDLRKCLVSTYISEIPVDPSTGFNRCASSGCPETYSSEYTVQQLESNQIRICAPGFSEEALGNPNQFCLTR